MATYAVKELMSDRAQEAAKIFLEVVKLRSTKSDQSWVNYVTNSVPFNKYSDDLASGTVYKLSFNPKRFSFKHGN